MGKGRVFSTLWENGHVTGKTVAEEVWIRNSSRSPVQNITSETTVEKQVSQIVTVALLCPAVLLSGGRFISTCLPKGIVSKKTKIMKGKTSMNLRL